MSKIEFEIMHEPRHFNRNANCMIPEAYTALIYVDDEPLPKWPCGKNREEAIQNVKREYPTGVEISA